MPLKPEPIAWGAKVDEPFRGAVRRLCARLAMDPNDLMACMAFESGRTFSPSVRNAAGSGAVGLIQFMPSTAAALGTTSEELALMSGPQQLVFVESYFRPWKNRLRTLSDIYMAILWPGAVGKPEDYVLFSKADPKRPKLFLQNAGLDFNRDGLITKAEAASGPAAMLSRGLQKENVG